MTLHLLLVLITILLIIFASSLSLSIPSWESSSKNYTQHWGYVTVDSKNEGNIFWRFYQRHTPSVTISPTILYLEGGPGTSSLFPDLCEIGPINGCTTHPPSPRNHSLSWLSQANLLFIDQPVGTGFSYVKNSNGFVKTDQQNVEQIIHVLQKVFNKHKELHQSPLWIIGHSYGGKIAAMLSEQLSTNNNKKHNLTVNFKGLGISAGWITPEGCTNSYGSYLKAFSLLDQEQQEILNEYAEKTSQALKNGLYSQATYLWFQGQTLIEKYTGGISSFNILEYSPPIDIKSLSEYVNGPLRRKLKIIPCDVEWKLQSKKVIENLSTDYMKPAISSVETLLNNGETVLVYTGQLDLTVNNLCTENWINSLNWNGIKKWKHNQRDIIYIDGVPQGSRKSYKSLHVYTLLNAGHLMGIDNPQILSKIIKENVM
eukprot:gb/GECH01009878.1/.p1 GENE.gb/GECH01009878.1/~~gb/GECH01009878.1/.p1  ORF type:complete len:428 (+),score=83.20 gb/GECH01009878.1/:1-1284(+)